MRPAIADVITSMEDFKNDTYADDYAKVMVNGFVDDLKSTTEVADKRTHLLDLLDSFKHDSFCNKNFSDCLDCENHKECDAIRAVMELLSASEWGKPQN